MEPFLHEVARHVSHSLELLAIAVIAFGAVESVVGIVRIRLRTAVRELVWLKFARWLVAGMTFQLAADLIATSFDPSWDQIGHLAAIAVIRTFMSYSLDREIDAKEAAWQREHAKSV